MEEGLDYSDDPLMLQDTTVYFNSNQYHGNQFLTEVAAMAGYLHTDFRPDPSSFAEKGIGALLQQHSLITVEASEEILLRSLIQHRSVGSSVKNTLDARKALHSNVPITWSSPEREWLFRLLVFESHRIPSESRSPSELKGFLAQLDDCPHNSFNDADSGDVNPVKPSKSSSRCGLEPLFEAEEQAKSDLHPADSIHAELHAQEALASLMWASTLRRIDQLQEHFLLTSSNETALGPDQIPALEEQEAVSTSTQLATSSGSDDAGLAHEPQLNAYLQELRSATSTLQSLATSSKRLRKRLLDQSFSSQQEGRMSASMQADLGARLDEHLEAVLSQPVPEPRAFDGIEQRGENEDEEGYEETLERLANEWGDWYNDDYVWSAEDTQGIGTVRARSIDAFPAGQNSQFAIDMEFEEEEDNLELDLSRMDEEWKQWSVETQPD